MAYDRRIKLRTPGWEKLGGLDYRGKEKSEQLQVADLYAYIINGWITRNGDVSPDRLRAAQMFFEKRSLIRVQNAASFENILREIDAEVMKAVTDVSR